MKKNNTLLLIIPSVFFVLFWIGFGLYHHYRLSVSSQNADLQVQDISPVFDTDTISNLKKRLQITPLYEFSTTTVTPSPTPTITTNQATSSAQASQGGTLAL